MLIAWHSIAPKNGVFPRDSKGAYIPKEEILEAIGSALVFYLIKKDKSLENSIKKAILATSSKPQLDRIGFHIKAEVLKKYPITLKVPSKLYLPKVEKVFIERFDYSKKEFVERFESEIFKGAVEEFEIESDNETLLKNALLSFARGLAEQEHKELKDTILEPYIVQVQNLIANEWENTLRVGEWTKTPYRGSLLFFWRIKEVREKLLKEFNVDIRPKDTLFIPKFKEFLGWSEWK